MNVWLAISIALNFGVEEGRKTIREAVESGRVNTTLLWYEIAQFSSNSDLSEPERIVLQESFERYVPVEIKDRIRDMAKAIVSKPAKRRGRPPGKVLCCIIGW